MFLLIPAIIDHYDDVDNLYVYVNHHWALYLSSGSVLATMSWPNLWSIIFFSMLAMMALITMVINAL